MSNVLCHVQNLDLNTYTHRTYTQRQRQRDKENQNGREAEYEQVTMIHMYKNVSETHYFVSN